MLFEYYCLGTNLILFLVQFYSSCMRKKDVMSYHVGLYPRVPKGAVSYIVRTSTWCYVTSCIPFTTECIWLVKSGPELHSITKFLKAELRIVMIVIADLLEDKMTDLLKTHPIEIC